MGLFNHNDEDKAVCPTPSVNNPDQVHVVGNLSFHHLIVIISGACLAFSCTVCFYLIFRHATHYSLPKEQRQIIRIIFMIPVFSAVAFLSVAFNSAHIYLKPIEDLYESLALASFFLLLCAYVQEDDCSREEYFSSSGTTQHYLAATFGAFQFPVVMLIVLVATEITEAIGKYCVTSNNAHFAHIWLTIIVLISTVVAIMSILRFYKALKPVIASRSPLPKLIAFKGIVFLSFIQNTIFSFLSSSSSLHPTSHTTYNDLSIGIPNLLLSLEMTLFSLAFLFIFRTAPYYYRPLPPSSSLPNNYSLSPPSSPDNPQTHTDGTHLREEENGFKVPLGHGGYTGGFLGGKAYVEALDVRDILRGIVSVPSMWARKKAMGGNGGSSGGRRGGGRRGRGRGEW